MPCSERLFGNLQGPAVEDFGLRISPLAHMDLAEVIGECRCSNAFAPRKCFLDPQGLPELCLGRRQFALLLVDHGQIVERHGDNMRASPPATYGNPRGPAEIAPRPRHSAPRCAARERW